jgi:hypothetical protein
MTTEIDGKRWDRVCDRAPAPASLRAVHFMIALRGDGTGKPLAA